mmetsp:Transcript_117396/g.165126  ORF Transcript_117396/g.165126 Transcript_117396/m.165126 type:complete len:83 (-) Transcript_117396:185-433(-)
MGHFCCISIMVMHVDSFASSSVKSLLDTLPAATAASSDARDACKPTPQISSASRRNPCALTFSELRGPVARGERDLDLRCIF